MTSSESSKFGKFHHLIHRIPLTVVLLFLLLEFCILLYVTGFVQKNFAALPPEIQDKLPRNMRITSASYEHGNQLDMQWSGFDISIADRGYTILAFSPPQNRLPAVRTFDTYDNEAASSKMLEYVDSLPDGTPLVIAVKDEATRMLTEDGVKAVRLAGAKIDLRGVYRMAHLVVGSKSLDSGRAYETVGRRISQFVNVTRPFRLASVVKFASFLFLPWLVLAICIAWIAVQQTKSDFAALLKQDAMDAGGVLLAGLMIHNLLSIAALAFFIIVGYLSLRLYKCSKFSLLPAWLIEPAKIFLWTRITLAFAAYFGLAFVQPRQAPHFWKLVPETLMIDMWARWDSEYYVTIMSDGYAYDPQTSSYAKYFPLQAKYSNNAFFPLYPLSVKFLSRMIPIYPEPFRFVVSGLLVSYASFFLALIFLYLLIESRTDAQTAERSLIYLSVFPTAFFFSAVYTESLFLMFTALAFLFAEKKCWALAGFAGFLATLTRFSGILLLPIFVVLFWEKNRRASVKQWFQTLGLIQIPLGFAAFGFLLHRAGCHPLNFLFSQKIFGRSAILPWAPLKSEILKIMHEGLQYGAYPLVSVLNVICSIGFIIAGAVVYQKISKAYGLYVIASVVVPLSTMMRCMSRFVVVLFPVFMLLGIWGRNPRLDRFFIAGFSSLMAVLAVLFGAWHFIA